MVEEAAPKTNEVIEQGSVEESKLFWGVQFRYKGRRYSVQFLLRDGEEEAARTHDRRLLSQEWAGQAIVLSRAQAPAAFGRMSSVLIQRDDTLAPASRWLYVERGC